MMIKSVAGIVVAMAVGVATVVGTRADVKFNDDELPVVWDARAEFHGLTTSKAIRIFRTGSNNNNVLSYSIGYYSDIYIYYHSTALCLTLIPKKCFSSGGDDNVYICMVIVFFFNHIGRNETVSLLKYTFSLVYFLFFVITIWIFFHFNFVTESRLTLNFHFAQSLFSLSLSFCLKHACAKSSFQIFIEHYFDEHVPIG